MVNMGCQMNGSIEKVHNDYGGWGWRDRKGIHKWIHAVCLQRLEADSGWVEVLNLKPEELELQYSAYKEKDSHTLKAMGWLEKLP